MSTGGTATCTSSEWLQNATAITAIQNATSTFSLKPRLKVDTLRGLGSGTQMALIAVGALTSVSNDAVDVGFIGVTGGKYQMKVTFNSNVSLLSSGNDLQANLPANGSFFVPFIWASVGGTCGCTLFDDSGGSYATASGTYAGSLNGATSGLISVNDCNIVGFDANAANVYNGLAVYSTVLTGATCYSPPTINDAGLIGLWWMNDAPSSSGAAAAVGGQALANNGGSVTYTGNIGALWGPSGPITPHQGTRRTQASYAALNRSYRW